jgi:hypothetical protein
MSQHPEELLDLLLLFKAEKVTRYLELGARDGDTFHAVMGSLPEGSTGVAVDLEDGAWGRKDSRPALERAVADLQARGYNASAVFGPTNTPATLNLVARRGPYDACLIDADHRYKAVRADWLAYGDLARIVVFHDIAGEGESDKHRGYPVEVPRLWQELRQEHRYVEIVAPKSTFGLGVILR